MTTRHEPAYIVPAHCATCSPWVRYFRTPTGHHARQELHEPHCETFPKIRRAG